MFQLPPESNHGEIKEEKNEENDNLDIVENAEDSHLKDDANKD